MNILFHRGLTILHGQIADHLAFHTARCVPAAPDGAVIDVLRAPVVGVQNIARITLERKHRPQKPRSVFTRMFHRKINRIGHGLQALTFRGVAQDIALFKRLDVIGFGLDHALGKCLVVDRAVVAFGIVFDRNLPVARLGDFDPFKRREIGDLWHVVGQFPAHAREPVVHRGRIRVEIDEEEAVEILAPNFGQADFGFVEARDGFDVWPGAQLAGQFIGPGVVGADHDAGRAAARDQLMRPVLADIVEGAHLPVVAPDRKKALASDLERDIVAGVGQRVGMAGKLPGAGQQTLHFLRKDARVGVIARVKRMDQRGGHALSS